MKFKELERHPYSVGGRAMVLAKKVHEEHDKTTCSIILKGLGLDCSLRDDFIFKEYEVMESGLKSPRIYVTVKPR